MEPSILAAEVVAVDLVAHRLAMAAQAVQVS
jgi:threonine dehydrogenase-like Zn-dependent dehydrogenase